MNSIISCVCHIKYFIINTQSFWRIKLSIIISKSTPLCYKITFKIKFLNLMKYVIWNKNKVFCNCYSLWRIKFPWTRTVYPPSIDEISWTIKNLNSWISKICYVKITLIIFNIRWGKRKLPGSIFPDSPHSSSKAWFPNAADDWENDIPRSNTEKSRTRDIPICIRIYFKNLK